MTSLIGTPKNMSNPRDKQKSYIPAEDQILYLCTRQDFQDQHRQKVQEICHLEDIRWDRIFITAREHGVAPVVSVNLRKCDELDINIPEEIAGKFRLATVHTIAMTGKRTDQLVKISAFFDNRSIDIMIIKGAALEILVYDQPWYTTSKDLDLIIKMDPAEFKQSDRWELEDLKRDIPLEYDFLEHHDVTINGVLPIDFNTIWEDSNQIDVKGQKLFVMSQEDMLITSCINSSRDRYFRLKSLFDIAEIINRFPELDWGELVRKARVYQCSNIVYAALWTTKEILGVAMPATVFSDLDIHYMRAQIIQGLVHRFPSHPISSQSSGIKIFERQVTPSLLLPYATYRLDQLVRKINYLWISRETEKIRSNKL
ncbi:nucleotidyltransferase family protein [Chloroflexota bacterium]